MSALPAELALDLVDEVLVQLEEPAQEAGDEQQVLLAVGELLGAALGVVQALLRCRRCRRAAWPCSRA